jgi:hypothetical protein
MEGDVHFVVVPRGHPVSGPSDIFQSGDVRVANSRAFAEGALHDHAVVDASTGAVVIGSKFEVEVQHCPGCERGTIFVDTPGRGFTHEQVVANLEPGTAYDVYFVSETTGSHGVYGKVSAAMPFVTHAMAPDILSYLVTAVDARSDSLRLAVSLSTAGILHYAVSLHTGTPIRIAVEETTVVLDANGTTTTTTTTNTTTRGLSAKEIVARGVGGGGGGKAAGSSGSGSNETATPSPPYAFVATGQVAGHRGVQTTHVISGLPPGTGFDVFLVSETMESGGVYGEVSQWESAFTHDVSPVTLKPLNPQP